MDLNMLYTWLMIFLMLVPFTQPFAIVALSARNNVNSTVEVVEEVPVIVEEVKELTLEDKILSSMLTIDLDGYATIGYPVSYFSYNSTESTGVYKQLDYNDNKSRIYMSYVTGMAIGADIPGYIANTLAKVDTYTNNKVEEEYNGIEWMKITADKQIDDCNVYIYYTLNKNNTSAFWMKVKVRPEAEDEVFNTIIEKMLNSYNMYAVNGEFVFSTPSEGYYEEHDVTDSTEADTSDKMANNDENNQVFKYRGGYVLGADISDNWDDLEIIVDGCKFALPATLSDFINNDFKINDPAIVQLSQSYEDLESVELYASQFVELNLENDNGTVITVGIKNNNASEKQCILYCDVMELTIDNSKFIDKVATVEDEYYNNATAEDEYASQNAKDAYNHELILARGVTWDAYADEIERIYTTGNYVESMYSTELKNILFESGPKSMLIRIGTVKGIKYIKFSCMGN